MNVLVVDDSAAMRMVVIRTLRQAGLSGHNFAQAPDGEAALDSIKKATPDLVLCDWNMPNMTGIQMLQALRAEGDTVKVAFVTSESSAVIRQEADAAGASFFLSKPINPEQLAEAMTSKVLR